MFLTCQLLSQGLPNMLEYIEVKDPCGETALQYGDIRQ